MKEAISPARVDNDAATWELQSSIYEGFSTEIWADKRKTGKRTVAVVREYQDAKLILAAIARAEAAEARAQAAERESTKLKALQNADWFDDIAEFLDQYQDAEIIDGRTHPNKAMRLLAQLREVGL